MRFSTFVAGAAITLGLAAAGAANAGLTGDTVSADYVWPTVSDVLYPSGSAIVGAGVEFDNIGGFGVGASPSVDFSDTNILVDYVGGWSLSGSGSFDGWRFTDFSSRTITGVSLAGTNLAGFTAADLSFDGSHIYANTLGLGPDFAAGTFISIDVASVAGTVPEPATWAILLVGFGGMGAALRRRRALAA